MFSMGLFWHVLNNHFIGFEETSSYWSFQFLSVFLWSPSIGKPCMTPVSKQGTSHLSSGGGRGVRFLLLLLGGEDVFIFT